jgi:regulator of protease activity HflC (stomatin/prohibitin superfamily)
LISLRVHNFETGSSRTAEVRDAAGRVTLEKGRSHGRPSKVNDRNGNPVEISAVVVWRVTNTAEASFQVEDYEDFVAVQSEAALRSLASRYPYDSVDGDLSLRGSTDEICRQLQTDIQERLDQAGVEILEARISYLAYAPEIAAAMLQRQQASAVVACAGSDCRRCRRNGPNGARPFEAGQYRRSERRTKGGHGVQPPCGALQ